MKTKVSLIGLVILLFANTVFAQKVITGQVTSADDGSALPGVNILLKGTTIGAITDFNGEYSVTVPNEEGVLVFSYIGFVTEEVKIESKTKIDVSMHADTVELEEVVVTGYHTVEKKQVTGAIVSVAAEELSSSPSNKVSKALRGRMAGVQIRGMSSLPQEINSEDYAGTQENKFHIALDKPLSTFSIDVDAASYSNVRRFLNQGRTPPKDAVRIEEMINYFSYDYKEPAGQHPFSINTEISEAPWNDKHKLVHIGLQGKNIPTKDLPPSNLVFLIDVSGSMSSHNKLPLLKKAFKLLVQQLRPEDNVSIVVYAGAAGCVLPSTSGSEKAKIISALDQLQSGGSTAGGAGIKLAYGLAKENFKPDGNNRVIIATDGDFNVGASSNQAMEDLIEDKRKEGTFLTVLGFGMGNYKDSKMEILADKGNGNYAYIDNILEAQKVFVNEFGGTLFTIAKDVKIQVEFNPAKVKAYRLIGYENRMLQAEDFNNDKKDAGELGAGHTVTALYEVVPVGVESEFVIDPLKYQKTTTEITQAAKNSNELMTVKLRYKEPKGTKSKLITHELIGRNVKLNKTSDSFRWSAAIAGLGMLLKDSDFKKDLTYQSVLELAKSAKGTDDEGYRAELIRLVKSSQLLAER